MSFVVNTKYGQYQSQIAMHSSCNRMKSFMEKNLRHCICKQSRMYPEFMLHVHRGYANEGNKIPDQAKDKSIVTS